MSESRPILTISALSRYVQQKFDRDPYLQEIWVTGEISNYRYRPNNHQFFALKEDEEIIQAVMFKQSFARLKFKPEEGMKVIVKARLSVYTKGGRYQLYIEDMEPEGMGALYLALQQLKEKLQKQGLFDLPKKRLVAFPTRIAVITSPTGAVIRDIVTTIRRRYPNIELVLFPSRVQGKEAVEDLITAFNQVKAYPDPFDCVILARGGGSIEDLWCFNDENLAHTIVACPYPVISSIGHETDFTIADFVADIRAATPTAAAELAVPSQVEVQNTILQAQERMLSSLHHRISRYQELLNKYSQSYTLTQADRLYQTYQEQLGRLLDRLVLSQGHRLEKSRQVHQQMSQGLFYYQPAKQVANYRQFLSHQVKLLDQAWQKQYREFDHQLKRSNYLLDAFSPLKVMARGYAIIQEGEQVITSIRQVDPGQELNLSMSDGHLAVKVLEIHANQNEQRD